MGGGATALAGDSSAGMGLQRMNSTVPGRVHVSPRPHQTVSAELNGGVSELSTSLGELAAFGRPRPLHTELSAASQTYGSILTVILHINNVPCCWVRVAG